MFTKCPNRRCGSVYRVRAQNLQVAMGMVRCPRCGIVFNALAGLSDQAPETQAQDIGLQLPIVQRGDRLVLDAKSAEGRALYQHLLEQPRSPLAGSKQVTARETAAPKPPPGPDAAAEPEPAPGPRETPVPKPEARPAPPSPLRGRFAALRPTREDLGLALRNLLRHRKRTSLGLAAISFGVVALLLAGGFIEWNNWALRESTIQSRLGHIQAVRPGYFEAGEAAPFEYLLPDAAPKRRAIREMPHVEAVAPRLKFTGLVSHGDTTLSFMGEGVVAEQETQVSRRLTVFSGENLSSSDPNGVIVGKGLAANLGVEPGDTVVLLATPASGGMNAVEASVRGLFYTSSKPFDDAFLRVPLEMAQGLMRVQGAHTWVILLDETHRTPEMLQTLRTRFANAGDELQFVPWIELADFYKKTVVLFSAQMDVVRVVIALIILMSISNTLVMGVLERTSEIGTLMALGFKRLKILQLFVSEGVLLGVLGGTLGVGLGLGLAEIISAIGIPMPPSPGMDFSFTGRIMVTSTLALGALFMAISTTVLASLYPALKASRLEIVDALRHSK